MTSLYEISKSYNLLTDMDQTDEAVINTLKGIDAEFNVKAENINYVLTRCDDDKVAIKKEVDRLNAMKKRLDNRQDHLKNYLRENMEKTRITKIDCPLFKITLGKASPMLVIDDLNSIPMDYKEITVTYKANNAKLLRDLKDGKEIEGCHLGKSKSKLIIK